MAVVAAVEAADNACMNLTGRITSSVIKANR